MKKVETRPNAFFDTPKMERTLGHFVGKEYVMSVNLRMEKGGGSNKSQRANDAKHFKLALLTFLLYLGSIS